MLCVRVGPAALGPDQREVLGVGAWMLLWWLTEPVPLAVTSLLPIIVLPLFGVVTMKDATSPYASEMIFLFLAGFLLEAHSRADPQPGWFPAVAAERRSSCA